MSEAFSEYDGETVEENNDIRFMHVPTVELYDDLMQQLEDRGYTFLSGVKPKGSGGHVIFDKNTVVVVERDTQQCSVTDVDNLLHGNITWKFIEPYTKGVNIQ